MATNMIFKYTEGYERALADATAPSAPTSILSGVPVLFGTRSAVSITASPNATRTETLPDGSSITYGIGGVGNKAGHASFAFDGSWDLPVTGATTSTKNDVPVYITTTGTLTLTEGTNTLFGITNYPRDYVKAAGRAVVQIGV